MNKLKRIAGGALLVAAFAAIASLCGSAAAGELARTLAAQESRLPGSEGCEKAGQAVEAKLKEAGLEPRRMTFNTLVPKTKSCSLEIEGERIGSLHPLGPNGIAPTSSGGAPLEGKLVWIGDGSLAEMAGKQIEGSVAALNFRSPNLKLAFSQGAKAAVLVGDGSETQWQIAKSFTEAPVGAPVLFIDGRNADGVHLKELARSGRKQAKLSVVTVWEDVQAFNIWACIPGEPGKTFRLDTEEALVFGAVLDSFGAVPALCPEPRMAANCELLADVACKLAKSGFKPSRSLYFVFFGSHYSAQDGARNFYFAIDKSLEGGYNNDTLQVRASAYKREMELVERQIKILEQPDIFNINDQELSSFAFDVQDKLSKMLDSVVNDINYELQRKSLAAGAKPLPAQKAEIARLKAEKATWNNLRREMMKRDIKDRESLLRLAEKYKKDLQLQLVQVSRMAENNETFIALGEGLKGKSIAGHFDFNFSDAATPWTLDISGDARITRNEGADFNNDVNVANFAKSMAAISSVYEEAAKGKDWKAPLLLDSLGGLYNPVALSLPLERSMPSNVAPGTGAYGYQFETVGDSLDRDSLPYAWEAPDLLPLSPMLQDLTKALANAEELSIRGPMLKARTYADVAYFYNGGSYVGTRYMCFSNGSVSEIEGTPDNAIVTAPSSSFMRTPIPGYTRIPFSRINKAGFVFLPQIAHARNPAGSILAFGFDDFGELNRFPTPARKDRLFYGYGGALPFTFAPANYGFINATSVKTLNAKNNSPFRSNFSCSGRDAVCEFFDKPYDFKMLVDGIALLGAEESRPLGYGITFDRLGLLSTNVVAQSAHDLCELNRSRLDILRKKNIVNDSIETIHSDAVERLEAAAESRKSLDIEKAVAHETFAASLAARASKPLRDISNDMVQAVIVLLILSIPFSFFMERLLCGFTNIYSQVAAFSGFFVTTFGLLYIVHPAFSLASAPIVIFLAFVIVIMSSLVIYIVMSKFKVELKAMQGLSSTVHGAAGESSAALAAVLIGITGMRNRPLKTALTATTVILLTFTILVFASFSSKIGVVDSYLGKAQGPDRIEAHRFTFLNIPAQFVDASKTLYGKDWDVFTRSSVFKDPTSPDAVPESIVYNPATGKSVKIDAILGLDPGELKRNSDLAQAIGVSLDGQDLAAPPLALPPAVAESLGLKRGDIVSIRGRKFAFDGAFNPLAVEEAQTLDGAKIAPPDYLSTAQETGGDASKMAGKDAEDNQQVDTSSFTYFSSQQIAICPESALTDFNPARNFVAFYPRAGADMAATAKELAQVFQGPVYSKSADGARQHFFTKEIKASGLAEVAVPLLLGGLIIFSSLLGSIIERGKEIFTYSALGLAPPDVGTLFFAESSVYAVLGGMGGYLFSQGVAFLLSTLASFGLFHPPEMNFSSLSSVLTILIVMSTVMLSTIYPALKAGKSANPGVARRWKMPSPEGDKISFVFPFTVSADDMAGILAFVGEHFENHSDATLGNFAANAVAVYAKEGRPGISATVSLAPFDLGVFQFFDMKAKPSEIAGIDEVVVTLERRNGAKGAWLRGNRIFIDELRNQFLLWRSLPAETVAHYKSRTAKSRVRSQESAANA